MYSLYASVSWAENWTAFLLSSAVNLVSSKLLTLKQGIYTWCSAIDLVDAAELAVWLQSAADPDCDQTFTECTKFFSSSNIQGLNSDFTDTLHVSLDIWLPTPLAIVTKIISGYRIGFHMGMVSMYQEFFLGKTRKTEWSGITYLSLPNAIAVTTVTLVRT